MNSLSRLLLVTLMLVSPQLLANDTSIKGFQALAESTMPYHYAANTCKASQKPKRVGCKFTCKPCLIPVCNNGVWELETQELPPSCSTSPLKPPSSENSACNIERFDFCPPSCRSCTRN